MSLKQARTVLLQISVVVLTRNTPFAVLAESVASATGLLQKIAWCEDLHVTTCKKNLVKSR